MLSSQDLRNDRKVQQQLHYYRDRVYKCGKLKDDMIASLKKSRKILADDDDAVSKIDQEIDDIRELYASFEKEVSNLKKKTRGLWSEESRSASINMSTY